MEARFFRSPSGPSGGQWMASGHYLVTNFRFLVLASPLQAVDL